MSKKRGSPPQVPPLPGMTPLGLRGKSPVPLSAPLAEKVADTERLLIQRRLMRKTALSRGAVTTLRRKLNPSALKTSAKMTALLGYLLDADWTTPRIVELSTTSDGYVMANGEFFGAASDVQRNLTGLWEQKIITDRELAYLRARFEATMFGS